MKTKFAAIVALVFLTVLSHAHEFWLQPKKFRYKVGEEMKVDLMVGEGFAGDPWDLTRHKVEKLEIHTGAAVKNLIKELKPTKGNNLTYRFDRAGTHLVVMESDFAFIELEADKFNEYLKEDGIENILEERTKAGLLGKPSREYYKRYAKLIVQSGDRVDNTALRIAGFRYEIVPLANPYSLKTGDYLDCKLLWEGQPVPHTMIKVWSHVGNRVFLQNIYSESDGTIRFPISSAGPWMVSSVKMIASEKEGADYQSLWSSLVFEIQ